MEQLTWGRPVALVAAAAALAGAALVWTVDVTGLHVGLAYLFGGDTLRTQDWWLSCGAALVLGAVLTAGAAVLTSRAWAVTGALLGLAVTVGFVLRLALDPAIDKLGIDELGPGLWLSFAAGVLVLVAAFGVGRPD